jgi:ABC-2 type transport system permease protein
VHGTSDPRHPDHPHDDIAILPFAVLAAWCAAGLTITLRLMTRRA